jgi:hypothetical protein
LMSGTLVPHTSWFCTKNALYVNYVATMSYPNADDFHGKSANV